jgi:hypothetical protein
MRRIVLGLVALIGLGLFVAPASAREVRHAGRSHGRVAHRKVVRHRVYRNGYRHAGGWWYGPKRFHR